MLISFSRQCIFIHIFKTGGGSVTTALGAYNSLPPAPLYQRVLRRLGLARRPHFNLHVTMQQLRQELEDRVFCSFFKFAFVRNPWDREISHLHYISQRPQHSMHARVKKMSGFEEYVEWRVLQKRILQKEFVTDANGSVI